MEKAVAKTRVALAACASYSRGEVSRAVAKAIGLLGGIRAFLPAHGFVLVKPNMLSPRPPSHAVTTHPEVVRAVVDLLLRATGADVAVGDSPGHGGVLGTAQECGIAAICHEMGVPLIPLDEKIQARNTSGCVCKEFTLARPVLEAGAIINVAKMKTHGFMTYTGAVKNLLGCIPGTEKARMHLRYQDPNAFAMMLLDLLAVVRPRLSLLDAVVAMDGDGPSHGRVRPIGAIIASEDPIALDAVALQLVGVDPMKVPSLRAARERGLGPTTLGAVEIVGASLEDFSVADFRLPPPARATTGVFTIVRAIRKHITARPSVNPAKCVGCGTCADSCPLHAITIGASKKAQIDDSSCTRCFCCHEMCPEGAITLRRGILARLADQAFEWA